MGSGNVNEGQGETGGEGLETNSPKAKLWAGTAARTRHGAGLWPWGRTRAGTGLGRWGGPGFRLRLGFRFRPGSGFRFNGTTGAGTWAPFWVASLVFALGLVSTLWVGLPGTIFNSWPRARPRARTRPGHGRFLLPFLSFLFALLALGAATLRTAAFGAAALGATTFGAAAPALLALLRTVAALLFLPLAFALAFLALRSAARVKICNYFMIYSLVQKSTAKHTNFWSLILKNFPPGTGAATAAALTATAALARPTAPGARPENKCIFEYIYLKQSSRYRWLPLTRLLTWSGYGCVNKSGDAWLQGDPRSVESFCRSPQCRPAFPEPSSCQHRAWTLSPPHSSDPCGCRRMSPLRPASCSPLQNQKQMLCERLVLDPKNLSDFSGIESKLELMVCSVVSVHKWHTFRSCQLQRLERFSTMRR